MLYFAYGMNTNNDSMAMRCPGAVNLGYVQAPDHRLVFKFHASIEKSVGTVADGVLWEITDDCLVSLDATEGYPTYYSREMITVVHQGQERLAMAYFMNPTEIDYLPPADYYWSLLTTGYMQNNVPLDQLHVALDMTRCNNTAFIV